MRPRLGAKAGCQFQPFHSPGALSEREGGACFVGDDPLCARTPAQQKIA